MNVLHKIKNTGVRIETSVLHGLITHLFQFKKDPEVYQKRKLNVPVTELSIVLMKSIRGFVELLNTQWQKSETSLLDCINNYNFRDDNGQISCLNYLEITISEGKFSESLSYLKLIIEM